MNDAWERSETWIRRGTGFAVEVKHHTVGPRDGWGPHRWAVYAYIYPSHRLFEAFDGPRMFQDAACALPLHGGPSFLRWHRDYDGTVTSVQVGADYAHLGDDHYSRYEPPALAVFVDADALFDHLAEVTA